MGRMARLRAIAGQVSVFAKAEALASGLPGQDQEPGDAYRHMLGVAELSRRVGPLLAAAMAERNEWESTEAMLRSLLDGRMPAQSNMPGARRMDRHNNLLVVGTGAVASSTEDVVMRIRSMMERAIETDGGSGRGNTPYWRPYRYWSEGAPLREWSAENWPDLAQATHMHVYRQQLGASPPERESAAGGGPVQVRPHVRDGHPVSGHMRSVPAN